MVSTAGGSHLPCEGGDGHGMGSRTLLFHHRNVPSPVIKPNEMWHHRKSHKGLAGHILFSSFFNGDGFSITMIAMLDYMRWQEKLRTSEIGRVHKESWTITICRARCSRCGRKRWAQRSLFFENASASVQPWALRRTKMMVLFVPWMINLVHV